MLAGTPAGVQACPGHISGDIAVLSPRLFAVIPPG
jgi:hypothetical protein